MKVFKTVFIINSVLGHNLYPNHAQDDKILPWPKLNSDPKTTLLTYIHIPKTAGATFKNNLHFRVINPSQRHKIKNRKIFKNFFPPQRLSSWSHPGCGRFTVESGIHCGYSELNDCIGKRRGFFLSRFDGVENVTNRFLTILRDPVERVISEFVWWNFPKHGGGCPGPWSQNHCDEYNLLEDMKKDGGQCEFLRNCDDLVYCRN